MGMKQKIRMIPLALAFLMGSTGVFLYPKETIRSVKEDMTQVSEEQFCYMQTPFIESADTDTVLLENGNWKQYIAVDRQYTKEQTEKDAELFAQGEHIVEVEEQPDQYRYVYSNNSTLVDGRYRICYNTPQNEKISYERYIKGNKQGLWTDKESAFPLEELEDFSCSEAIEQIQTLCSRLGVALSEEAPEVYVMDAQHMTDLMLQSDTLQYYKTKKQYSKVNQGEEITWTKDDEVYYMIFQINMQEFPLTEKGFDTASNFAAGSEVVAAVGRNGIQYFQAEGLYNIIMAEELEGSICSAAEAMKVMKSNCAYTDGFATRTVSEMKMVYVPVGTQDAALHTYTVRPYWECMITYVKTTQRDGQTFAYTVEDVVLIDAVTKAVYKG